jgi:hypothetical protein
LSVADPLPPLFARIMAGPMSRYEV